MSKLAKLNRILKGENTLPAETPEEKKKLAEKLLLLNKEPVLAVFDELQEIKHLLRVISTKDENIELQMPEPPEPQPFPEIPETDLSETNQLLKEVLSELKKPKKEENIEVNLDLT